MLKQHFRYISWYIYFKYTYIELTYISEEVYFYKSLPKIYLT